MSWLPRSLADPLRLDDNDDEEEEEGRKDKTQYAVVTHSKNEIDLDNNVDGRGVKEGLSELKETLTRQIWGVASFLAPPPPAVQLDLNRIESVDPSNLIGESDSVFDAVVGVTDEALTFARNIAHHPETWLDFPLEEEEFDDFEISEAEQKHAFSVERLAPRLAALRIELCPVHMSEGYFWMVYFVLLHTRLNKHDAELLSTPQLVEARAMWMQELQKKTKPDSDFFGMNTLLMKESTYSPREDLDSTSSEDAHSRYFVPQRSFAFEPTTYHSTHDIETEKLEHGSAEIQFIDEAVIEENPSSKILDKELVAGPSSKPLFLDYDEHEDDWLQYIEESECYSGTGVSMGNEEEISFSDLEDDIDCLMPVKSKIL
ncbi:hypothetical protein RND71_038365 [Anisodus tanguticus]|uniref:BSD domain-containing protein n=1 Tax=Anisodus tanguticus TaxID=243964 RepID=A0AAE1UZ36_9SOLA|nr:hypothetical protein RND71_038365 [Anisodus tanguticus]